MYNLRGNFNLSIPKVNTSRYGLKSWRYAVEKHWNTLPWDIRSVAGSKDFLKKIRQTDFHFWYPLTYDLSHLDRRIL